MILLTPQQIEKIVAEIVMDTPFVSSVEEQTERLKRFASKLNKAQLKKVVEYLGADCIEHPLLSTLPNVLSYAFSRIECPKCWQALLKEVE